MSLENVKRMGTFADTFWIATWLVSFPPVAFLSLFVVVHVGGPEHPFDRKKWPMIWRETAAFELALAASFFNFAASLAILGVWAVAVWAFFAALPVWGLSTTFRIRSDGIKWARQKSDSELIRGREMTAAQLRLASGLKDGTVSPEYVSRNYPPRYVEHTMRIVADCSLERRASLALFFSDEEILRRGLSVSSSEGTVPR